MRCNFIYTILHDNVSSKHEVILLVRILLLNPFNLACLLLRYQSGVALLLVAPGVAGGGGEGEFPFLLPGLLLSGSGRLPLLPRLSGFDVVTC